MSEEEQTASVDGATPWVYVDDVSDVCSGSGCNESAHGDSSMSEDKQTSDMEAPKRSETLAQIPKILKEEGSFAKWAFRISDALFGMAYVLYVGAICIGNYGCMLVNLSFFVTSFITYVFAPIYHGLNREWLEYGFSLAQVIVTCPYVQFGLLIIFDWIKDVANIIGILKETWYSTTEISQALMVGVFRKKEDKTAFWINLVAVYIMELGLNAAIISFIFIPLFRGHFSLLHLCFWFSYIGFAGLGVSCLFYNFIFWCADFFILCGVDCCSIFLDEFIHGLVLAKYVREHNSDYIVGQAKIYSEMDTEKDYEIGTSIFKHSGRLLKLSASIQYVPCFMTISCFSHHIASQDDDYIIGETRYSRRRCSVLIFTLLNYATVIFDIYRASQESTAYFTASVVLRMLFVPTVSVLNPCVLFEKKKDKYYATYLLNDENKEEAEEEEKRARSLCIWMWVGFIMTILVLLAALIAPPVIPLLLNLIRIDNLPEFDPNRVSTYPTSYHSNAGGYACSYSYGISASQAVGFSLGPYDVIRNTTIFDHQMSHFFGPDWKNDIDYEVFYISSGVPCMKYTIQSLNKTIISFGGFSSGKEFAMQLELLSSQYVLPFFQDMIPFYDYISNNIFSDYTSTAQNMGFHFYDPNTMIMNYITPTIKFCEQENLANDENVIFTGINIGGTIAKIFGMLMHRPAIAFMSLPSQNPLYESLISFDEDMSLYLANIYHDGGYFSFEEAGKAANMAIPKIPLSFTKSESVYHSFCALTELCHERDQYWQYCENVVGKEALEEIYGYFDATVFNPFENETSIVYKMF